MRPRVKRIIISVLVGLLGSAATVGYGWWKISTPAPLDYLRGVMRAPDGREWGWDCFRTRWSSQGVADIFEAPLRHEYKWYDAMPADPDLTGGIAGARAAEEVFCEERYGWPWRCARAAEYLTPPSTSSNGRRIVAGVKVEWKGHKASYVLLPTQPFWTGLAADTAFFATPVFVTLEVAAFVRSRRRKRMGRCECCGYDRRGLLPGATCPECGPKPEVVGAKA